MNREPGLFAVVGLLARTATKRWFNRVRGNLGATWGRKKKKAGRTATGRKSPRSMLGMAVFGGLMLFQAFFISSNFVGGLVYDVEVRRYEPDVVEESPALGLGGGGLVKVQPPRRHVSLLPSTDNWVAPRLQDDLLRLIAPVLTLLMAALVFYSLGAGNTELSQVGWSMEWLFTFPVPTRGLLLARTAEYALSSVFTWFTVFPLLSTVFWNSGWGPAGLLLGLFATIGVAFMVGAVRMVVETALRKRFSLHRLKNFQAICTILGMLFLFGTFGIAFTGKTPDRLSDVADVAGEPLLWLPGAVALQVVRGVAGIGGLLAWTALIVFACLRAARTLVRDGLVSAGGPYQGSRKAGSRKRGPRITGVLGKDLRLLLRDRNFMVQTLVVPLIVIGFQAIVNPALFRSGGSPNTVAVTAFGVGAYVLIFGGFSILAVEGNALWLLFSLPARLDEILRRKAVVWILPGLAYAGGILAFAWRPGADASVGVYAAPLLALAGIAIFAFLAGGMGAMGTDPFEREMQRKVRPEWSMLYMLVAGIYGYCIVKAPPWRQAGLVVLVTMLTWAIWDRVKERLPYLLDPTRAPPPRIAMSDGLVAGLVFLFLTVVCVALLAGGLPPGAALATGYAIAGALTVLLTLYSLWRLGLRGILVKVGFSRAGLVPALAWGCGLGAATGLLAWGYVRALPRFGVELPQTMKVVSGSRWLLLLVVVLAPLFEEFIFRGLLFNGMRRATRLPVAILGSALVFGLVHPPQSFPPVFLLGAVAAWLFHRTGLLWSSIAAHVTYNAIVVWVQS